MADEIALQNLYDGFLELELKTIKQVFKSIKSVNVFRREIKIKKWKFFSFTRKQKIVRFVVNEPEYILDLLTTDLNIENYVVKFSDDHILEIVNEEGNPII